MLEKRNCLWGSNLAEIPEYDGWATLVDADRGMAADGVGRDDVGALVGEDAGGEAGGELLPVVARPGPLARGSSRVES